MTFSLKDSLKAFFCLCCFIQNHVSYMSFQCILTAGFFSIHSPTRGGLRVRGYSKSKRHIWCGWGNPDRSLEKKLLLLKLVRITMKASALLNAIFWEHIHLIWNHSAASPKTRNSLIIRIFMRRLSDEYETQLYECFYSSLLHLISKAIIRLQ